MSGRMYDCQGIPICKECGGDMLRADERNYWGVLCESCGGKVASNYDRMHSDWIGYMRYIEKYQLDNLFIDFEECSYKYYKNKIK